jgi:hypothetical protein
MLCSNSQAQSQLKKCAHQLIGKWICQFKANVGNKIVVYKFHTFDNSRREGLQCQGIWRSWSKKIYDERMKSIVKGLFLFRNLWEEIP